MEWYKKLDIHTRINWKESFVLLCGTEWSSVAKLLPLRVMIDLLYDKLIYEGFEIE